MSDPVGRLALVSAAIEAVGGVVTAARPLADPGSPGVLAAHWVSASATTRSAWLEVEQVLEAHHVDVSGMVPWLPPVEEVSGAGGGS